MIKSLSKKLWIPALFMFMTVFVLYSVAGAAVTGGGSDTITQLDQFTSTTSPVTGITQKTYGKSIIITGLTNSQNLCLDSFGRVTTSGCTGGSGGGGSPVYPFTTFTNYAATSTALGLLNGLFSTASSTVSGPLRLSTLSAGQLNVGASGLLYSGASTTFSGGLTYSNGNVTCTGCGAAGNPDLTYLTLSGTAFYTASSTLTDNKSFYFGNGFLANASSTVVADFHVGGKLFVNNVTNPTGSQAVIAGTNGILDLFSSNASSFFYLSPTGFDRWRIGAGDLNINDFGIYDNDQSIHALSIIGGTGTNKGYLGIGTTTPGTGFSFGATGTGINLVDNGTSTFSGKGIDLRNGGCFSISGVCVSSSGGSFTNTIANGGTGATSFTPNAIVGVNAAGTALIATGTSQALYVPAIIATTSINSGFGTTTPFGMLSIHAQAGEPSFVIGSSSGTSFIVDTSGNVGIGTTAVSDANGLNALRVVGKPGTDILGLSDGVANFGFFIQNNSTVAPIQMGSVSNHDYGFFTNNQAPQLTLKTGGQTAVGTTTAFYKLTVATTNNTPQFALSAGAGINQFILANEGGNFYLAPTNVQGNATGTTAFTALGSNGFIGIGTTNPQSLLHVAGTGIQRERVESTNSSIAGINLLSGVKNWYVENRGGQDTPNNRLAISSDTNEAISILTTGMAGFSTTTPTYPLTAFAGAGPQFALSAGAGLNQWVAANEGGSLYIAPTNTAGTATTSLTALSMTTAGAVGVGTANPRFALDVNGNIGLTGYITGTSGLNIFGDNSASFGITLLTTGLIGVGTTTPQYRLTPFSSTAPQLSLSAGAGVTQWTARNAGGNFYLGTTTVQGLATSTVPYLTILNNGGMGINDSTPDATLEIVGAVSGSYFELSKTGDGDIFNVNSSGLVGIGTSTPPSLLTLNPTNAQLNSVNPILLIGTSTLSGASAFGTYVAVNAPNGFGGNFIDLQTNNSSVFKVSSNATGVFGQVLFGTSTSNVSPAKLVIATSTQSQISLGDGLGGTTPFNLRSVGNNFYIATSSATTQATSSVASFSINSGGVIAFGNYPDCTTTSNAVAIVSTQVVCHTLVSDERLKKDITPFEHGLDIVMNVQPKTWFFIDNHLPGLATEDTSLQYGFIAQDIEKYAPELVSMTTPSYLTPDGTKTYNPDEKIVILWNAVRQLAQIKGVMRSAEENWQDLLIGLLIAYVVYNEWDKRKKSHEK